MADTYVCKGSFALGTACGKCSKCLKEIADYKAGQQASDKLYTPTSSPQTERVLRQRIRELEADLKSLRNAGDRLSFCARASVERAEQNADLVDAINGWADAVSPDTDTGG